MKEEDIVISWYYFCSLATQLNKTIQYVDHSVDSNNKFYNGSTFSNEFSKILMLASSEFEVISKKLCIESGLCTKKTTLNIVSITECIVKAYPCIGETKISTPYLTLQPLKNWGVSNKGNRKKVIGVDWWIAHNNIKHQRSEHFRSANLKNTVYSMASLAIIEIYLSKVVLGNTDRISSISCDYFNIDYGLASLLVRTGKQLPDFL